jgi:hypothetical protein
MWARGVTSIVQDDGSLLGGSVAGVNRETGVMYINKPLVDSMQLSKEVLLFIMLHEMGHMVLQTSDEVAVDEWAHKEYLKRGYSLKQSVYALTQILRFSKDEDYIRANLQLQRAKQYDS